MPPRSAFNKEINGEDKMRTTIKRAVCLMASASLGVVVIEAASAEQEARELKIIHNFYDGVSNDLLTAGLGKTGLGSATAPGFADPLHPTAEELRRSAIYNNYRALVDPTPGGGYGTLYGPNVKPDGTVTASEGLI